MSTPTEDVSEEVVIDLNEEKKTESKEEKTQSPTVNVIPAKRIDALTDAEKKILIENARTGVDNPNYTVKLYKNGSARICKRKKPSISQMAVSSMGERLLINTPGDSNRVYMTDSQLIWEHVLELENKYNNLYRKHKKLKSKYNDLYIEDEDVPQQRANYVPQQEQRQEQQEVQPPRQQEQHEPVQQEVQPQTLSEQQQPVYQAAPSRTNWRSMIMNR